MNSFSLGQRLEQTKFRPSGFDYMRLVLAVAVIFDHSFILSYGRATFESMLDGAWFRPLVMLILPMFFTLSGFLVAGSLERSKTLVTFLGLRALRIVPALTVEVVLSALVLGPLLTSYDLASYFSHEEFSSYFLNIIGDIHFRLPGVFHDNPNPFKVNGQLWTIPAELQCYVILAALSVLGLFGNRKLLAVVLLVLVAQQIRSAFVIGGMDASMISLRGTDLVRNFMAGVILYRFRDKVPFHFGLLVASAVLAYVMMANSYGLRFAFLPCAYMTVYLGLLNPPRQSWLLSGDYSYGLYLYSSAIQQTIASFGPAFQHWYWSFLIGLPVSVVVACGSWWLVEKPTLGFRNYLKIAEDFILPTWLRWQGVLRGLVPAFFSRALSTPVETASTTSSPPS